MRTILRVLLISNFIVLFAVIGPGSSHQLYLETRALGLAHVIVKAVQLWVLAATGGTTILFIVMVFSKTETSRPRKPTKLDWSLFLGWWVVIAMCVVSAFMMGMGG